MTRDDIIRMAMEVGGTVLAVYSPDLERFAALVAATERESNIRAVRAVQAAYDKKLDGGPSIEGSVCSDCIGAIRARGQA